MNKIKSIFTLVLITHIQSVCCFSPLLHGVLKPSISSQLGAIRCENKYYQLEEREDRDSCTMELFLLEDRNVEFGNTDGPNYLTAKGTWEIFPGSNDFKMTIIRTYETGQPSTDIGEYKYEIKRVFLGEMTNVGASVGITGVMFNIDEVFGDQEVGYFNMIDATEERESIGDDKKVWKISVAGNS